MALNDKRIFIIEDSLENRVIAQTILEREGAATSFERWGKDTVRKLREFMPADIILLDLMFPNEITGYDIFDEIRQYSEFDNIPIVAVSASDPSSAIPMTKARGFAGFIAKPINLARFPSLVAQAIENEPVWVRS